MTCTSARHFCLRANGSSKCEKHLVVCYVLVKLSLIITVDTSLDDAVMYSAIKWRRLLQMCIGRKIKVYIGLFS